MLFLGDIFPSPNDEKDITRQDAKTIRESQEGYRHRAREKEDKSRFATSIIDGIESQRHFFHTQYRRYQYPTPLEIRT